MSNQEYSNIVRVKPISYDSGGVEFAITPCLATDFKAEREIIDEGIDDHSFTLGGRTVHWRIEKRGPELLYCSSFIASRDEMERIMDPSAINEVVGSDQQEMNVTIETELESLPSSDFGPNGELVFAKATRHSSK